MLRYFEFKVSLVGVEPEIWRSFLLRATATFADLHEAIQSACGWWNYHLYVFRRPPAHPHENGLPIAGLPSDEDQDLYGRALPDAEKTKLPLFFGKSKNRLCDYEYDFGDGWLHSVRLVGEREAEGSFRRKLLGGERAFPHEDCGGLGGYERCVEFVRTGIDEQDDDPEGLRKWLDGWHPDKFDFELTRKYFDANWHVPIAGEPWVPNEQQLAQIAQGKRPKGMPLGFD